MHTVIYHANAYVARDRFAQALWIEDGVIRQVGSDEEILAAAPADAQRIDAQGHTLVPGFIDSHQHLYHVGQNLLTVDLSHCTSLDQIVEAGRQFIQQHQVPPGETVQGWGWNQDYFTEGPQMPTRHTLDQISTEHPLLFTRACGHVMTCNTLALQKAGVWDEVPQVEGGQLDLEEDGRPNGIVRESNAKQLFDGLLPQETEAKQEQILQAAMDYAAKKGVTSVQTNDVAGDNFAQMLSLYDRITHDRRSLRVYMQCCMMTKEQLQAFLDAGHRTGKGDEWLKIGPLKMFTDGSLGARTALMRQDYADAPGQRGIEILTQQELDELVRMADENGMQIAIHAIGDKANEMVLDSYQKVIGPEGNTHRHGIVHCQITDLPMLKRYQQMDVYAMVQPIFLHYDLHIVEDRVGKELAATSYAFHTMNQMGLHVSYGTDSPVEDMDPIQNLHCAVCRQDLKHFPAGGYVPEERVDIFQAVDDYTIGGAQNAFEENQKGRLQPGYLADLVMLDQDIFHVPSDKILDTQVLMTMVGGKVVYEK
ncbi:MAG TPA: amidohydrolase [Firmicutes bacterium]|nr:amidohydrolase [Bacillota bacterium]